MFINFPGVVVSALASINEVNLRRARLVLRWATVSVMPCLWRLGGSLYLLRQVS